MNIFWKATWVKLFKKENSPWLIIISFKLIYSIWLCPILSFLHLFRFAYLSLYPPLNCLFCYQMLSVLSLKLLKYLQLLNMQALPLPLMYNEQLNACFCHALVELSQPYRRLNDWLIDWVKGGQRLEHIASFYCSGAEIPLLPLIFLLRSWNSTPLFVRSL